MKVHRLHTRKNKGTYTQRLKVKQQDTLEVVEIVVDLQEAVVCTCGFAAEHICNAEDFGLGKCEVGLCWECASDGAITNTSEHSFMDELKTLCPKHFNQWLEKK